MALVVAARTFTYVIVTSSKTTPFVTITRTEVVEELTGSEQSTLIPTSGTIPVQS